MSKKSIFRFLPASILLLGSLCSSQTATGPEVIRGWLGLTPVPVAKLLTLHPSTAPAYASVSDGIDATNGCATGGGTTFLFCWWNGATWQVANGAGGGGSTNPANPNLSLQYNGNGFFAGLANFKLSTDLAGFLATDIRTANFPVFDLREYGLVGDGKLILNCSGNSGQKVLTCTGATFSSADVGKIAGVHAGGTAGGSTGEFLNSTITAASSNTITLATNILHSVTNTDVWYGTDNYAAWCAAMNCTSATVPNVIYTSQPGRTVLLPRGTYMMSNAGYTRNGDQLIGAGYTATTIVTLAENSNQRTLWVGANASGGTGTGTLDSGGLDNRVEGITFAQPEPTVDSTTPICVDTLNYSGVDIIKSWFFCGIGVNTQANIGHITGNYFDSSSDIGIQASCGSTCGYDTQNQSHTMDVGDNFFYLLKNDAITLDGIDGWMIHNNGFNYTQNADILFNTASGNVSHRVLIQGNQFVTSDGAGNYSCTNNYGINFASACENCEVLGNGFVHKHNYDIAQSAVTNGLIIADNESKADCEGGVCTNTCSGQTAGTGQQNNSIDLETASANVVVKGNHFSGSGQYCGRFLTPVRLEGNTCHAPFTVNPADSGGGFTANGGFTFPGAAAANSTAKNNSTDSTTVAAVVAWNGAEPIISDSNHSGYSGGDFISSTGNTNVYSSWQERASNSGSSTTAAFSSQMSPTTGNAAFAGSLSSATLSVGTSATINNLTCTGTPVNCGSGGGGGGVNPGPQFNLSGYTNVGTNSLVGPLSGITFDNTLNDLTAFGTVTGGDVTAAYSTMGAGTFTGYSSPGILSRFQHIGSAVTSSPCGAGQSGISLAASLLPHYCLGGVDLGGITFLSGVAGTDTVTATSGGITAYDNKIVYCWIPAISNATTSPTMNIDSVGAINLKGNRGIAATVGEFSSGHYTCMTYNGSQFEDLSGGGSGGTVALNSITSATGSPSPLLNGNNSIIWQWQLTALNGNAMTFGESTASTGTGSAIARYTTLPGSTASAYRAAAGGLTGSQTGPPVASYSTVLNTSGVVDSVLGIAVTNTASGAGSRILNTTVGGTSVFSTDVTGKVLANAYGTISNCASAASPAVCGSAAAGRFVVAAGSTSVVVNTTAVTANSEIIVANDSSLGTALSVTCNVSFLAAPPQITARTAATSFTISVSAAPSTNPQCFSYRITN